MPNIATAFKQEISRLARREIRIHVLGLQKSSAQFRRDIAELKRQAAKLRSEVTRLERQAGKEIAPQVAGAERANVRFTAKGVKSQRERLGISAADYGKLVGVTGHTIYQWEHGTSRPRMAQLTALASLRGIGKREALARLEPMRSKASGGRKAKRKAKR